MRTLLKSWIVRAAALLFVASAALAQDRVPFRQAELDQMLAPVALYPDSLLSQMLMASTYPLEIVQAARWSRANPGLKGQSAVDAVERMDWDPSVKSLTAFPQILARMDEQLEWTERLGEAFLAQQEDVMSTVQGLRRRAEAAGNLRSSDQMRVVRQDEAIVIESPVPQIVYVPYYNPTVVYGPWWWSAYPPVYWAPPPAYYAVPAYGPGFYWGSGIVISAGLFFGHFDWHHRHVNVTHVHHHHGRPVHSHWRHDPAHRRGVPFRNADAHRRFEQRLEQSRHADARRDADRGERERPGFHADRSRTAEVRQRNLDERRGITPGERRTGDRDDGQRGPTESRLRPGQSGTRVDHAINRESGRLPAPADGARASRPETRDARPHARNHAADPDTRPARPASQAADERGGRQQRDIEPRRATVAPPARAVSPAPAVREESRPAVVPASRQAETRRSVEPGRRAHAHDGNHSPQPRFAARGESPAPRANAAPAQRPSAATPAAGMNHPSRPADRSPRAGGRDSDRRH